MASGPSKLLLFRAPRIILRLWSRRLGTAVAGARTATALSMCSPGLVHSRCLPGLLLSAAASASSPQIVSNEPSAIFTSNSSIDTGGGGRVSARADFGDPRRRATDALLVLNCAGWALQWASRGWLTFWGAKVNACILEQGQLWRLFTPMFLHSGLLHLAINLYALHSLGPQVELLSGSRRFLAVYLSAGVVGTAASVAFTPAPSLGASGAIFGLGAALGVFYWRHREALGSRSDSVLKSLGVTLAVNFLYSLAVRNIDNWGHLGGMLGGASLAWLLGPRMMFVPAEEEDTGSPSWGRRLPLGGLNPLPARLHRGGRGPSGTFEDRPPVPWLAHPPGTSFSSRGQAAGARGAQGGGGRTAGGGAPAGHESLPPSVFSTFGGAGAAVLLESPGEGGASVLTGTAAAERRRPELQGKRGRRRLKTNQDSKPIDQDSKAKADLNDSSP